MGKPKVRIGATTKTGRKVIASTKTGPKIRRK